MLSVWGALISFWSVLVFSLAFFRHFFRGTVCLSSFVFPGAFFSVFFSNELEAFCSRLALLPDSRVLAHLFSIFSIWEVLITTSSMSALSINQQLLRAPGLRFLTWLQSLVLWPSPFDSPSLLSFFVQRTSPLVPQCGSSPFLALFFPRSFPAIFPALPWMLPSLAGTLRLPPFCIYLHLWPSCFDSPSLLSLLLFVHRTSPFILQCGFSPCFQHCFPHYFQLCLGCYQLAFLTAVSSTPGSCSACLAWSVEVSFIAS